MPAGTQSPASFIHSSAEVILIILTELNSMVPPSPALKGWQPLLYTKLHHKLHHAGGAEVEGVRCITPPSTSCKSRR